MTIAPIYRDTIYVYTGDSLTYSITLDGETIFQGRAYAAPGEDTIRININRVCENYLSNFDIEGILNGLVESNTAVTAFREFILLDSGGTTLETYKFLYNYDYDGYFSGSGMALSDPISTDIDNRMIPIYSYFNGTEVINTSGTGHYTPAVFCNAEYALYYLNAKGGWDFFLIQGNSLRTDKVDRHQYNKTYNNQTIEYEKNTYISEISTSWKLYTGILDDTQAHKLCWHLLSSNRVYLHNLKADKIIPVVITNTNNIYNTYSNNEHQPVQFEIDITESQTKLRQ